jgi:rfaE bifunctional protein nucleotidyltransferase chain/domain/rfaE bifunctional protein kinase chain/domain
MDVTPLVIVGDALLDREVEGTVHRVCPDAPAPVVAVDRERARPGGAALAAVMAAQDGPAVLVSAVPDDDAGRLLRDLLARAGVQLHVIPVPGPTPEKVRVRSGGQTLVRFDRGASTQPVGLPGDDAVDALRSAKVVLASDYGRGVLASGGVQAALRSRSGSTLSVWDPHPRGTAPPAGPWLVTPNAGELATFVPVATRDGGSPDTDDIETIIRRSDSLRDRWRVAAVAVTMGARGALLCDGTQPHFVPATPASGDTCGAGDRFAAAVARRLGDGYLLSEAIEFAVARSSSYVAHGGASAFDWPPVDPTTTVRRAGDGFELAAQVRSAGGTCVATGGCFDLLHAGHVSMLEAARRLGDCLVVCLNSDDSVRRLKGSGRPRQTASDRAEVLLALECVDAVVVFDDDTPVEVLRRLKPHLFVKGADYRVSALPEAHAIAAWGGRAVALPYLAGRSTTRLLQEATNDAW